MVHDYAQNYLCKHQDEIQALHWSHAQVTIHPSSVSYRCPIQDCNKVVLYEIVHISNDLKHDAHLVKNFQAENIKILKKRGVDICKLVEFTDQAPSQYKNKSAFRYLSQETIPTIRNFFGVRHGKGPCDACAGRVKNKIATLVKTGECVINSARSCFEACKDNIETQWPSNDECCHYLITFVFTSKIPKRPDTSKWKGVKDTRDHMHSIMNTGEHLKVNICNVVCLCTGCLHGDSKCKYPEYVDKWRGCNMTKGTDIPTSFQLWKSVRIRKTVGSQEDYGWEDVRAILHAFEDFDALQAYIKRNPLPFFDCHINLQLSECDRQHLDLVALHYIPPDAPEGLAPCTIGSDGNCFPRTLSFICFRSEAMHVEFHVHLLYEAILHAKHYLSNQYISRGCNIVYRQGGPVKKIAMYASSYNPNEPLDVVKT